MRAWTPARSTSALSDLLTELDRRDDAFSEIELDVAPLDVGGDYACAEWTVTMTHTGPLEVAGGTIIEPTNVRITLQGVTVAEFRGDRICALRQYWDELAVFDQLGLPRCSITEGDVVTATDTRAVLDHHSKALLAGDLDGVMEDYTEESVFISNLGGAVKGRDVIRSMFAAAGDFAGHEETSVYVEGEYAYVTWKMAGVTFASDTFVVRNGKIVLQTVAMVFG